MCSVAQGLESVMQHVFNEGSGVSKLIVTNLGNPSLLQTGIFPKFKAK